MQNKPPTKLSVDSDDPEPLSTDQLLFHMTKLTGFENRNRDPEKPAVGISSLDSLRRSSNKATSLKVKDRQSRTLDDPFNVAAPDNVTKFPGNNFNQAKPRPK